MKHFKDILIILFEPIMMILSFVALIQSVVLYFSGEIEKAIYYLGLVILIKVTLEK